MTYQGNRGRLGLLGLLAGVGLVVAARAATNQPATHRTAVVLPAPSPTTSVTQQQGTAATTTTAAAAAPPAAGPVTVDGSVVDTPYGPVQVAVTFNGSRITDVRTLQMPQDANRSIRLAQVSAPMLRQEVLTAQSAQIDTVSGATYDSDGYAQSVQYAIDHRVR